tara:strand:+ start:1467 stop:1805 length:339 start_codon:yes stop_codon:yes gene_type:complete
MNTQERIYSKLNSINKVELEAHKIELGAIDDIKKEMAAANKGAIRGIDMIEAAKKPLENSLKLNKSLFKKIAKSKKIAKELGASNALKQIEKFESQVNENIKSIDKILSGIY